MDLLIMKSRWWGCVDSSLLGWDIRYEYLDIHPPCFFPPMFVVMSIWFCK